MTPYLVPKHLKKWLFAAVFLTFSVFPLCEVPGAGRMTFEQRKEICERKIPEIAERYIGIPYGYGKNFEASGALDNSHLFCLIYEEAARQASLRFVGYMPMKALLYNTTRVQRDEVKNGDLIVLNNGHAAMIYKVDEGDRLHMIYASLKRRQVFSFTSENVVYDVYWLVNLKGFYRLKDGMFMYAEDVD